MILKSLKEVFASIFTRPTRTAEPRPAEPCPVEPRPADGHEFEVDGICYIITSSKKLTVELKEGSSHTGGISIPASVTYKGRTYAVTSIGKNAFWDCTSLKSVTIPNGVTSIGDDAFFGCKALRRVTIPSSVTSIGKKAFCDCTGLTSIEIPSSVTSIGECAFYNCSGLTNVTIEDGTTNLKFGKSVFDNAPFKTLYLGRNITCSSSNSSIQPFRGNTTLISLTIGNYMTSIGQQAFDGCSRLTSVSIPNSVTDIGSSAFHNCSGLTSVKIPNSVTSIGEYAFYNCSGLTNVTISSRAKCIGFGAFGYCPSITSLTSYAATPPACDRDAFDRIHKDKARCTLHVPAGTKALYQAAPQWKDFDNIVEDAEKA